MNVIPDFVGGCSSMDIDIFGRPFAAGFNQD